jgi:radical SAM family RiPP maturation amino acid epimerase
MSIATRPVPSAKATEFYRRIFLSRSEEELQQIARIKRFVERFIGDDEFRHGLHGHGSRDAESLRASGLEVDPQAVRPLWHPDHGGRRLTPEEGTAWPLAALYVRFLDDLRTYRALTRSQGAMPEASPRFHAWRERQIARCASEMPSSADFIMHGVAAFELSLGCSKGCWFCGVSAARFAGHFAYSEPNARLWREMVGIVQDLFGEASHTAFCYWATDPSDNPDYAKFLRDYLALTGHVPQTTTAAPLKNIELTRELLALAERREGGPLRFSAVSLGSLRDIHRTFSARELLAVDVICQNKEALGAMAMAGRARDRHQEGKGPAGGALGRLREEHATIACVSGFLVNMMKRTVQLVAPAAASDRWPLGYRIYEERRFEDAAGFRAHLEGMVERHMPESWPAERPVSFRADLTFEESPAEAPAGFRLQSRWATHETQGPFMRRLGRLVAAGSQTLETLRAGLAADAGDPAHIDGALQHLFDNGLLDDEPV